MKRIFLYFLLVMFIGGLVTLAFGFWNAKNIRHWATAAADIKARNDILGKEKSIEDRMNSSGGKKAEEFNAELAGFESDLDSVAKEMDAVKSETESLGAPRAVRPTRTELIGFYRDSAEQIQNVADVVKFMEKVFAVTAIFDKMNPDTTAQEIRDIITEAKSKSGEIDTGTLPAELRNSGNDLKVSTDNYLDQVDQFATGKIDSHDQLNASYDVFSEKVNDFLLAKKNYFDSFENMDSTGKKIDNELMILERVRFSVR